MSEIVKDRLFAVIWFLLGYGFIWMCVDATFSKSLAMYTICYAAAVLLYLYSKGKKPPKESWFWLVVLLCVGIPFAFWTVLYIFQFFLLMAIAAYWTLSATGRLLKEGKTSEWVFFDGWNALILVPFGNYGSQFKVLFQRQAVEEGEEKKENKLGAVLLGLLIAIPLFVIVLPLLARADTGFQQLTAGLVYYIQKNLLGIFLRCIFAVPVSLYLYGLIFGGITGNKTDIIQTEKLKVVGNKVRVVSGMTIATALILISLTYAVFIGLQGNYLFSAFFGKLPEEFTYANYARRGFFELCQVGFWNLVILGGAERFAKTGNNKVLKIMTIVLSVETLLLLATAVAKLGMYISVYGLTVNRVIPMVFLLWMVLVFICIILRQKKEFPLIRFCVLAGMVMLCILCVFPIENWTYAYNDWARIQGWIV